MDADNRTPDGKSLLDVLVGIELGVVGGLVTLLWWVLICPVIGEGWWLIPNLFASHFYAAWQILLGPGIITWVGIAIHLFVSGVLGAINGVLTPGGRLFGLGLIIAWYLLCTFALWKRFAPMLAGAPQAVIIAGYFLFGSVLGWHRHLLDYGFGRTLIHTTEPRTPVS